ncbi:hypothetical protein [Streptosporangium sp. NPDC000396]|uniref:hypothetical protein n=1 Tax=Streptosporangium sp. NPDC000396 TaxID=3366185 RepID=UPI003683C22F
MSAGALFEALTENWTTLPLLEQTRTQLGIELAVGFGLDDSARLSVRSAELALRRAREHGPSCGYLQTGDGLVIGPIGTGHTPLRSAYKTIATDLQALAKRTGLGTATLSRLSSLERLVAGSPVSAEEISQHLQLSPPSGRRIIRTLREYQLATPVCVSQPTRRGRPKTLYKLHLND